MDSALTRASLVQWEDQGTGSLMLKRDKGAALKSKEANARIVFRNPVSIPAPRSI